MQTQWMLFSFTDSWKTTWMVFTFTYQTLLRWKTPWLRRLLYRLLLRLLRMFSFSNSSLLSRRPTHQQRLLHFLRPLPPHLRRLRLTYVDSPTPTPTPSPTLDRAALLHPSFRTVSDTNSLLRLLLSLHRHNWSTPPCAPLHFLLQFLSSCNRSEI